MDIYELTESILETVFGESFFHGMPEFGVDQEPDKYAVYTVRERPVNYASNIAHAKKYWVEVSVFTPKAEPKLYKQTETAFTNADFLYSGGVSVGNANLFPYKNQYAMDFIIDIQED